MRASSVLCSAMFAAAVGAFGGGCAAPDVPPLDERPPYATQVAPLVDPFIGTAGEGFTHPGAAAPWGMVTVSPHTTYGSAKDYLLEGRIAPAGYVHGAPQLHGFGFTQLSGVGCPELGAPVISALAGAPTTDRAARAADYAGEIAWPGYYAVSLPESRIRAEATAGRRVGLLRLRFFDDARDATVLVDAGRSLAWLTGEGRVRVISPSEVEGAVETGRFCMQPNRQTVYFAVRFSRPAAVVHTWRDAALGDETAQRGTDVGAALRFAAAGGAAIEAQVAVSYVSANNAWENLAAELGAAATPAFERVRARTHATWEQTLGRVRVSGGSAEQRTIFYTALYHMLLHPSLLSDADGEHPAMGGGPIRRAPAGSPRYTVFSLWDTYRNVHPFLSLVFPEQQQRLLRSIAAMTRESGRPPRWELIAQEVNMMVGDPALPTVADAYLKGLTDFDVETLYRAMRDGALELDGAAAHRPGNASYDALGYIPIEERETVYGPVSTTLEYALADWSLAQLARALGHAEDAARLEARSRGYRKLFDASTGMLRPRSADGAWLEPFDPLAIEGERSYRNAGGPGYVEGTAWHYAFFAPHDVEGLIALHGGPAAFTAQLQRAFDEDRFTLWNEPDIAYPYLFGYVAGEAWRTQREVHRARERFFSAAPDGLPGNDDAGTLSAWYVFSALGLYPDCPGAPRYSLTSPLFDRAELTLDRRLAPGGRLVIEAPHPSPEHVYVARVTLDGAPLTAPFVSHAQLVQGGTLAFELAARPPAR